MMTKEDERWRRLKTDAEWGEGGWRRNNEEGGGGRREKDEDGWCRRNTEEDGWEKEGNGEE